jgi:hypothetical protein
MVLDYKQMFDSECLYECLNDVYEAGVVDDKFVLLYEANRENFVAVQTPNGLSRREPVTEIVMQGDVLAPLISTLLGRNAWKRESTSTIIRTLSPFLLWG